MKEFIDKRRQKVEAFIVASVITLSWAPMIWMPTEYIQSQRVILGFICVTIGTFLTWLIMGMFMLLEEKIKPAESNSDEIGEVIEENNVTIEEKT